MDSNAITTKGTEIVKEYRGYRANISCGDNSRYVEIGIYGEDGMIGYLNYGDGQEAWNRAWHTFKNLNKIEDFRWFIKFHPAD